MADPRFCIRCGAGLDAGADFCSACGQPVAKAAEHTDPGSLPAAESSIRSAQTPQMSPADPPRGAPDRRSGKTLALIAGGVGVVVAVALMAFVFGGSSPSSTTSAPPTTSGSSGDETDTTDDVTTSTIAENAGLRDIVEERVGDFTLVNVDPVEEAIAAGAIDSLNTVYRHADGTDIGHSLELFPSAVEVANQVEAWAAALEDGGFQVTGEAEVVQDGQPGGVSVYRSETDEVVLWYIADLFFAAAGPLEKPLEFFEAVPYGYRLLDQGLEGMG